MSVEQAKQLIVRAATDSDFRERVDAADESEHGDILRAEGYGDVRGEHVEQARAELRDIDVENVSGGGMNVDPVQLFVDGEFDQMEGPGGGGPIVDKVQTGFDTGYDYVKGKLGSIF